MATISLTWDEPDSTLGGAVEEYDIFRAVGGTPSIHEDGDAVVSIAGTPIVTTVASTRAYTEELTTSGKHSYAVTAKNPAGSSSASNAVEVEIP